jgi:hypothetical protein
MNEARRQRRTVPRSCEICPGRPTPTSSPAPHAGHAGVCRDSALDDANHPELIRPGGGYCDGADRAGQVFKVLDLLGASYPFPVLQLAEIRDSFAPRAITIHSARRIPGVRIGVETKLLPSIIFLIVCLL